MRCIFHLISDSIPAAFPDDELHVLLYGGRPPYNRTAAIGSQMRDLYLRFGVQPSVAAVDFVSIALAVTAADTFVLRENSSNAWARDIEIVLPLRVPQNWVEVRPRLESALHFLTGDAWHFEFVSGGEAPPARKAIRNHQSTVDLSKVDLVSLFSGGLDSTISTFELMKNSKRPLLVSHAYRGDAAVQDYVRTRLPSGVEHVAVNAWPTSSLKSEITMRSRSFLFIAIAVLACDVRSRFSGGEAIDLLIPENGLIALNAPLTPRRLGALSTRTTHPHYLYSLQSILDEVQLKGRISNPYEQMTKGEMVGLLADDVAFKAVASHTVSCGKWKRSGQQCGHCVPCLIRRASLYGGNVDDHTDYATLDLCKVMREADERDDLVAMLSAVARLELENLESWVSRAGPLPDDIGRRAALVDVHRRGLTEVETFLTDSGLLA